VNPVVGRRPGPELAGDEGSVTALAAVLIASVLLVLALVVDGAALLRATSRADAVAAEAARAAVSVVDLRGPTVVLDRPRALAAAHAYLAANDATGTVTVDEAGGVQVDTRLRQPAPIGLLGGTIEATGRATAQLTVAARAPGPPP
jgi:hypothetical protein